MRAGLRILVVDDHVDTCVMLSRLLTGDGYAVDCAFSVAEAVARAAVTRPDVLLTDLGLPDGSGADLLRELRAACGVRGVALTGYGDGPHARECAAAGFDAVLVKPVTYELLSAAVRDAAAAAAAPAPAPAPARVPSDDDDDDDEDDASGRRGTAGRSPGTGTAAAAARTGASPTG